MLNIKWTSLSKERSDIYKALAIILIVWHNFMHLLPGPYENEFSYHEGRFQLLLDLILSAPENSLQYLLSFFGHYGVQIFIFLSAYGLAKKYQHNAPVYRVFIWERLSKIYPAFIIVMLIWPLSAFYSYGLLGPIKVIYWNLDSILLKLTLLSNFVPGQSLTPVGPWWFIPFIAQFYVIFPLLLKVNIRYGEKSLLLIAIISVLLNYLFDLWGIFNLNFTVIGHLPVLCLGLYLANKETNPKVSIFSIMAIAAIYVLGNLYPLLWWLNNLSFLILMLVFLQFAAEHIKLGSNSRGYLNFIAGISMYLFLVNGFLRQPFIDLALRYNSWFVTLVCCLIFFILCILVALVVGKAERYFLSQHNLFNSTLFIKFKDLFYTANKNR